MALIILALLGRVLMTLLILAGWTFRVQGQHRDVERPASWNDLAFGGRFMDRLEPIPLLSKRSAGTWGEAAVKPRDLQR